MKNIILIALACLIFNACGVPIDALLVKRIYINNSTNHVIKFLPYKNGLIITDSIKIFAPNTITLLESEKLYFPSPVNPIFDLRYQRVVDSTIVTFDGIKKEKHQFPGVTATYLPNKERCIETNDAGAYKEKIIEQRKKYAEVEYTYTFTEQDYLDADFFR